MPEGTAIAEAPPMSSPVIEPEVQPQAAPDTSEQPASAPPPTDKGPEQPKPKPGSAKAQLFKELRQKYGGETPETPTDTPAPQPKESEENPAETEEKPAPGKAAQPKTPEEKKKASPWKLLDEHKQARLKAESELAELRKQYGDPAKVKEQADKYAAIEKRNQELEQEMRFVNYSKSTEFQEKYQKPYEAAWKKWMGELGELMVTDSASGQERNLQPQDLLELVNMPLQKARAHAQDVYGAFADDVMSARKELRSLFDSQQTALEEARKMGEGWQARLQQEVGARRQALNNEIGTVWKQSNEQAIKDTKYGKFFTPIEGDEEGNTRLSKGFEMADKAFSVNPFDPRLTAEQRAEIVQLHAAVRNRAAAFGRLSLQNSRLEQQVTKLKAELNKYKSAEPAAAQEHPTTDTTTPSSAKESVFGALRKFAH